MIVSLQNNRKPQELSEEQIEIITQLCSSEALTEKEREAVALLLKLYKERGWEAQALRNVIVSTIKR